MILLQFCIPNFLDDQPEMYDTGLLLCSLCPAWFGWYGGREGLTAAVTVAAATFWPPEAACGRVLAARGCVWPCLGRQGPRVAVSWPPGAACGCVLSGARIITIGSPHVYHVLSMKAS